MGLQDLTTNGVNVPINIKKIDVKDILEEKCNNIELGLLELINKESLSIPELIYILARTLIDVGYSLEGINGNLTYEDMWRLYGENPSLGNALMAQGADMLVEWLKKLPEEI